MLSLRLLEDFVHATDYLAARLGRGRAAHLELGRRGEEAAFFYLRRRGYTVVARDWCSGKAPGDLDLVAWEGTTLCFVEVKTRTSRNVATAESAVDSDKTRVLRRLARRMKFASMSCQFITRLNSRWIFSFSMVLLVGIESSESDRWASPIVFSPGTLRRTWGTRRFPQMRLGLGVFVFFVPGHLNGFELGLIGL
jgi:Holliday junction resolvase-like predicted endonuclease